MKIFTFTFLLSILSFQSLLHAETLKATYGLFASGFEVVQVNGTFDVTDDKYNLKMDLETIGALGAVAPWSGRIQTIGIENGAQSSPLEYSFASTWKGDTETTKFIFNKDGKITSHTRRESDGQLITEKLDSDIYDGYPLDMMTAMYRAMNNPTCQVTPQVIDGKRKFDMAFQSKGFEVLKSSRYSRFSGKAEICEVEIIPVSGKWRDKPRGWMSIQEQAKDNGELPKIWFGRVRADMPPIPVRFYIKTNYGTMIMHLQSIQ